MGFPEMKIKQTKNTLIAPINYLANDDIERAIYQHPIFGICINPDVELVYAADCFGVIVNASTDFIAGKGPVAIACKKHEKYGGHLSVKNKEGEIETVTLPVPFFASSYDIVVYKCEDIRGRRENQKCLVFVAAFVKSSIRVNTYDRAKEIDSYFPRMPTIEEERVRIEEENRKNLEALVRRQMAEREAAIKADQKAILDAENKKKATKAALEKQKIDDARNKELAIAAQELKDAEERKRLARENEALAERLKIETQGEIDRANAKARTLEIEAEGRAYAARVEGEALAHKLQIQTDALEKEKALTMEILQMRNLIESQDTKGANDTAALLMELLNQRK